MDSGVRDGRDPGEPSLRVYLTGTIALEGGGRILPEQRLPGPLGRHLFAFLAAEHRRAVGHDEIALEIWYGTPPPSWATSLKALVSRTRSAAAAAGFHGAILAGAPGVYRFRLPSDGWVDVDAARSATHAAEALLRQGDSEAASQEAFVAKLITDRPLMAGIRGAWADGLRAQLAEFRVRALHCSARSELARGSFANAVWNAQRAVDVAPLREASWWLLMDAHAAAGDRAAALEAYERCRTRLDDELGIPPSAATRQRHAALLDCIADA